MPQFGLRSTLANLNLKLGPEGETAGWVAAFAAQRSAALNLGRRRPGTPIIHLIRYVDVTVSAFSKSAIARRLGMCHYYLRNAARKVDVGLSDSSTYTISYIQYMTPDPLFLILPMISVP